MSDLERARSALMLEIGAWGINLNASEDVDACVVALIAAAKREGVREAVGNLTDEAIWRFNTAAGFHVLSDRSAMCKQFRVDLLNALAKEGK